MAQSRIAARDHGFFFEKRHVMESTRRRSRIGLILFVGAVAALPARSQVGHFASIEDTLIAVGRRLSRSHSESALTGLASRGDAILRLLEPAERTALATRYLRFRVTVPVLVRLAAPAASEPFWVHDLG